jgi:hypothetical protein
MKLLKLVCALKSGENYPTGLYTERNSRTFLDWDCLIFQLPRNQYMEFACSEDYTYQPTVLLSVWVHNKKGKNPKLYCIQDLKEFDTSRCASDIAVAILHSNLAALNLQRYL